MGTSKSKVNEKEVNEIGTSKIFDIVAKVVSYTPDEQGDPRVSLAWSFVEEFEKYPGFNLRRFLKIAKVSEEDLEDWRDTEVGMGESKVNEKKGPRDFIDPLHGERLLKKLLNLS